MASDRRVPDPAEEEKLVAACIAGDTSAWNRLISRYEGVIYAIPRRYGLGDEDAAEVFQNVCLALYRGLPRLKLAAGLTSWVLVTTRRQSRDLAVKRRREIPDKDERLASQLIEPGMAADRWVEQLEASVEIRTAMESLKERCHQLLQWLYLDRKPLSYRDIASRLGIPEGTVGPTRARCLAKLRQVVEKRRLRGTK